ncbi:hypothetical protein SK128_014844, partial [Halocaridina rubra]
MRSKIICLVIYGLTLCQALRTEKDQIESPRHGRYFDMLRTFPKWTDIKDLTDFESLRDIKELMDHKDLVGLRDVRDMTDLHDLKKTIDLGERPYFDNFFPEGYLAPGIIECLREKQNLGKSEKREMPWTYYDYYDYGDYPSYAAEEGDYITDEEGEIYYDLTSLSLMDRKKLEKAKTVEDVLDIAGISLSPYGEDYPVRDKGAAFSALRSRNIHTKRHHNGVNFAKRATCEPEKVSVPLEPEKGIRVIPDCIRVKKCGGCCNSGFECVATKSKPLNLQVVEISAGSDNMHFRVLSNMTEDEECGCQCSTQKEDCLSTQDYNKDNCSCDCKSSLEEVRKECEKNHKLWDPYTCECQCPLSKPRSVADCGSGQNFNALAC